MMTLMKSTDKNLQGTLKPSPPAQRTHDMTSRPLRVKHSPWLMSTTKFVSSGGKSARHSGMTHVAPARTTISNEKLPDLSHDLHVKDNKSGTRFSDPIRSTRRNNLTNSKSQPDYVPPKLTKYRLEHPDRFSQLASKSSKTTRKKSNENIKDTSKEGPQLKSASKGPGQSGASKWQHMSQEYGIQQAMRESKLLQMSASNSHLPSSPKCSQNKSSSNLNVTLMDIANLTPKAIDRAQATNISDLLFNTYIDVQRFRRLLRDTEDEKTKSLTASIVERVNYCGEEKTKRIDDWLDTVETTRHKEGLESRTIPDNILYEDYTKDSPKENN